MFEKIAPHPLTIVTPLRVAPPLDFENETYSVTRGNCNGIWTDGQEESREYKDQKLCKSSTTFIANVINVKHGIAGHHTSYSRCTCYPQPRGFIYQPWRKWRWFPSRFLCRSDPVIPQLTADPKLTFPQITQVIRRLLEGRYYSDAGDGYVNFWSICWGSHTVSHLIF